jgi:hypothetical protein
MVKVIPLPKRDVINFLFDQQKQEIIENRNNETVNSSLLQKELSHLNKKVNTLKKQIQIVQFLSDNKIKFFDEIKNASLKKITQFPSVNKKDHFCLNNDNNFREALIYLPYIPISNIVKVNQQVPISNIPEPTEQQLKKIIESFIHRSLYHKWDQFINNQYRVEPDDIEFPKLTIEQAKELYYKKQQISIEHPRATEEQQLEYVINLTDQELYNHYQNTIADINFELKSLQNLQKILKVCLREINTSQFKAIPTYNGFGNTMTKSQHELIADLIRNNKSEEDKRILQEILVKHVMEDKDFTKEQKEEILQFIENSKSNKIIENCLMFPLTRDEKRVLRELRAEIYEQIQTGKITASGITDPQTGVTEPEVYIAHISYDKFFTLYGVSNDDKTTKHIKDILFGRSSKGLYKQIIVEHQPAITTQLILQIKEKKKKINLHKKEVDTGFTITMPSFLFVGQDKENAKDYYNQEDAGHRRFMQSGNMAQSDGASNIIYKLEMLCHSTLNNKKKKNKVVDWDLDTIVNIAGYEKRYKEKPKEVKARIENILNKMIEAKYLIESWQPKKGKYEQDQYIITPLKIN